MQIWSSKITGNDQVGFQKIRGCLIQTKTKASIDYGQVHVLDEVHTVSVEGYGAIA